MRAAVDLLRRERNARFFFAALTQSALGTGAGYVGLLLIAYDRFPSPWAVSLVLLADLLPAMLAGPWVGAGLDRWSRRGCAVAADLIRAAAFVGIALSGTFELTLAFALAAGLGTAIFKPAALAGLPSLVSRERAPAATSLYGAISDLGWTVGPGLAAIALLVTEPRTLMFVNGVTFVVSAGLLVRLPMDRALTIEEQGAHPAVKASLMREGLSGWREVLRAVDVRIVILASAAAMFCGGIFNVGELFFATQSLEAGGSGYSLLVAFYAFGVVMGSLSGSAGGSAPGIRRRYWQGLVLTAAGSLSAALSPGLLPALLSFTLGGFGNGRLVVHERILIQRRTPERLHGRAFVLSDTLVSWAFAGAFFVAGALASVISPRGLILACGIGEAIVAVVAVIALRQRSVTQLGLGPAQSRSPGGESA